ncbi:MAG: 4-alpha-glucanotransferase [Dermatophilus congolensis]|nr:4-alpha-glucanotransferase [Dermatophilus congolensis]
MSTHEQPSAILARLARAYGVATEYWDWKGEHVVVSAETIRAVLKAFDVDAHDDASAAHALQDHELRPWRRMVPSFTLLRKGRGSRIPVHVPHGDPVSVWLELEDWGGRRTLRQLDVWVDPRVVDGHLVGEATFEIPADLPLGWHTVYAEIPGDKAPVQGPVTGTVLVVPDAIDLPAAVATRGARGVAEQIYQVRSHSSWGMGDFADLADTCVWAGRDLRADFVLVNPVHAASPVPPVEPSPYLPTSRRFIDTTYIRVEDIPEVAYATPEVRARIEAIAAKGRALNTADIIDRDAVVTLKREALRLVFEVPRSVRRQLDFEHFCESGSDGLLDFATWCALIAEKQGSAQEWPQEWDGPTSPAVVEFREKNSDAVGFEMWLQWIADGQLDEVQRACRRIGMTIGVMKDLAVGVHPTGADAWTLGDVLARGVTVGAPPDPYSQRGQNWSQPPWRPDRLEEVGYRPFRDTLTAALRYSGGLRIDHVIGLFRLWWVPEGHDAIDGTYVRLDHEALIGILVLEAQRAGSIVVGEDLGTVEPWVRDYLSERGVLGTSILWFEQEDGGLRQPEAYRRLCLASVTTHDLPPTAGYLMGEHVKVRDRLDMFTQPVEQEWEAFHRERHMVLQRLHDRGLLPSANGHGWNDTFVEGNVEQIVEGLHRYVSWSPSLLVAIALADLVGDRRGINQPGTSVEYPNWKLPLSGPDGAAVWLEDLTSSRRSVRLARCVERGRPRGDQ